MTAIGPRVPAPARLFVATAVRVLADAAGHPEDRRVMWELLSPFLAPKTPFAPIQQALYDAVRQKREDRPVDIEDDLRQYHIRQGWYDRGG